MPTFLFSHHFPDGFQPSPETAAAAAAWFESLGEHRLNGRPATFDTQRIGNCRGEPMLTTYTLVTTDDLEAAVALASTWPMLARRGGVDVREFALVRTPVGSAV